jgi:hypothetical protein
LIWVLKILEAGWTSSNGSHGEHIFDTLFVKLKNPPQNISIPGLPENVVPIAKSKPTRPDSGFTDVYPAQTL